MDQAIPDNINQDRKIKHFSVEENKKYINDKDLLMRVIFYRYRTNADEQQKIFDILNWEFHDNNNMNVVGWLGNCYFTGLQYINLKADISKAINYYQIGLKFNNPTCMNNYGLCLLYGMGIKKNEKQAMRFFQNIVNSEISQTETGYQAALTNLGVYYEEQGNLEKSVEYYQAAADLGYARAQLNLSIQYFNGIFVNEDRKKSKEYFMLAKKQGIKNIQEHTFETFYQIQYQNGVEEEELDGDADIDDDIYS